MQTDSTCVNAYPTAVLGTRQRDVHPSLLFAVAFSPLYLLIAFKFRKALLNTWKGIDEK